MALSLACRAPLVALVALVVVSASPAGRAAAEEASPTPNLRLSSRVLMVGGSLRATVRVPRNERSRTLRISLDNDTYYASTELELDGERAAEVHEVTWNSLPAGAYVVEARLRLSDGREPTQVVCAAVLDPAVERSAQSAEAGSGWHDSAGRTALRPRCQ